jgi:hypothetical protein
MRVQEERHFRISIEDLRSALKQAHEVDLTGIDPYIDGDSIVFALKVERPGVDDPTSREGTPVEPVFAPANNRVRRRRRKRNRIKTRGWKVVGKITNSQGLVANIYEPFVTAAKGSTLSRHEIHRLFRQIMVRNGNNPAEESVDYFLNNTLEFLAQELKAARAGT